MAYQTYTTRAIVCGSRPRGERDRVMMLFTREGGMLSARAAGVRMVESKLRYALQDFSCAVVSLVRGKHEWRIVGAEAIDNLYAHASSRDCRTALLKSVRLLRRLVRGEEREERAFDMFWEDARMLSESPHPDRVSELLAVRLLHHLGYIAPPSSHEALFSGSLTDDVVVVYARNLVAQKWVLTATEGGIEASHL